MPFASALLAGLTLQSLAVAQPPPAMPGMDMPARSPAASSAPSTSSPATAKPPETPGADMSETKDTEMGRIDMGAMDMAGMDMSHPMVGALGDYPATREASGTAWQPDSAPHEGLHLHGGGWSAMVHGYAELVYDNQGGPRGDEKTFVLSHLMGMASRPMAGGTLGLHGLFSLDPLMGKSGYPLLLQTGETANGVTRLIDRQHPHDLIDELAVSYSHPVGAGLSAFVYGGPVGEPALGPVTYLHRFAGMADPETPIDHHWLDSTHVSFGVATAGLSGRTWKLEVSNFTGREPNQHRYDIEHPRFDSWSGRVTWNPSADWSLQASRGHLNSPEQLEPDTDQNRTTASATYNRHLHDGNWQTVFAWGRLEMLPAVGSGPTLDAYLLESALAKGANTVFGRLESAEKNELFPEGSPRDGEIDTVAKLSLGYFRTVPVSRHLAADLGGLVSKYAYQARLNSTYGSDPTSFMLFARVKLR